jgi:hypothetical protein
MAIQRQSKNYHVQSDLVHDQILFDMKKLHFLVLQALQFAQLLVRN